MKPAEPAMLFLTSGEASQEPEPEDAIPERPEPAVITPSQYPFQRFISPSDLLAIKYPTIGYTTCS